MWGWVSVGVAAFFGLSSGPLFGSLLVGVYAGVKCLGFYAGAFYILRGGREYQCVGGLQVSLVNCNAFFPQDPPVR